MLPFKTLIDVIQQNSSQHKTITFIEGANEETEFSYAELYRRALGLLRSLQQAGLEPGDELIFFLRNNEKFIEAFWACILGGIVPVPVAVGISDEHRSKVFRIYGQLQKPYVYTDAESCALLQSYAEKNGFSNEFSTIEKTLLLIENIAIAEQSGVVHPAGSDDIAFIQFSSGSTRDPKGVVLTHKNLLATNTAMGNRFNYCCDDISLSWMPLTHDLGIIGFHLNMLVFGMSQNIMATDLFSRRPLLWMQKTHEKRASVLSSPNFGYKHYLKLYESKQDHDLDLSCVRLIINGAEPISVDLCHQFLNTMGQHGLSQSVISPGYGLAEAGLSVALWPAEAAMQYVCVDRHSMRESGEIRFVNGDDRQAIKFANEGPVVEFCQLRIGDEVGNDLGELRVGEIQIKGANVTTGYYHDARANQDLFTADGWLRTGDLGFMQAGDLIVTGRLKDIIFVHGLNYYPHDIEAVIVEHCAIELGKVVVAGAHRDNADHDEIIAYVIHRGDNASFSLLAKKIKTVVSEKIGVEISHIVPVKRIPKTTSGKIQRRFLVEAYLNGEYQQIITELQAIDGSENHCSHQHADAHLNHYETQLLEMGARILPEKNISLDDNLFEIGTSSLDLAQLLEGIEKKYPGLLDMADIFEYPTLRAIAERLNDKVSVASNT